MNTQENITQFNLPHIERFTSSPNFSLGALHDLFIRREVESWYKENVKPLNGIVTSPKMSLELISYVYPLTNNKEMIILIGKFYAFLCTYDDEGMPVDLREFNSYIDRIFQVFEGKATGKTDHEKIMEYFSKEFRMKLNPRIIPVLSLSIQEWMKSTKQEYVFSLTGNDMNLDEYIQFREVNSGALMGIAIGEALLEIDASALIKDVFVSKAYHAAAKHFSLVNDLYSFRKEYFDNEEKANVLYILSKNHQLSIQEAVDKCCDLINQFKVEFVDACQQAHESCKSEETELMSSYFNLLSSIMCGNINYSQLSARYHGKANKQRIDNGMIIMNPDQTLFIPC